MFTAFFAKAQNDTVIFSAQGGFYEDVFQLELYNYYPQNHIRYTTNGNRPDANSPLYSDSLYLDESLYSTSDVYTIINCPENEFYLPDSVEHCIVIRAAVFDENDSCVSAVRTNSYFIRSLGCDTHGLPAVSLCADSLDLFDYQRGIFVPGAWWYSGLPEWTGNYFCKGRNWERVCNVEFYEQDNRGINQQAGLRTHGGASRRFQQKGMKLFAREEYGKKRFKHRFFSDAYIANVKHFCLKPFRGSNWLQSGLNDALCHQVARQLDIDVLGTRAVTVFLNGEYWGIYYLEEAPDERYIEDHYDIEPDICNIIKNWHELENGDDAEWRDLYEWMETADLTDSMDYSYICSKVDLDNFIDYTVFELYAANVDWPANNVRCWQAGDRKWRWMFYDGDGCFFRDWDVFANIADTSNNLGPSNAASTLFYRRLMANESFKQNLYERFMDLMSHKFGYEYTGPVLASLSATIADEIPNLSRRFSYPVSDSVWQADVDRIDAFLRNRNSMMEAQLMMLMHVVSFQTEVGFACYPNPFTNELHISIDADFGADEIAIYDMLGRKVFAMPCRFDHANPTLTFNPHLEAGVYVLKIGELTRKILRY